MLLLVSAAPARAALPEDGVRACENLRRQLVFIGEAGMPFSYRLFQEKIDRARDDFAKAKAARDQSPDDVDLLLAFLNAESDLKDWIAKSFVMTLVPMKIERVFRGNPAGESFIVLNRDMNIEPGRSYVFYGDDTWVSVGLQAYEGWTQEVSSATNAVRLLDASASNGGGIVYGSLDLEHTSDRDRLSPLAGVDVRLAAPGYLDQVATDTDGTFIATNVRPGPVTITPLVPESLGIANRALLRATVAPGRCVAMNVRAALNGRIRGKVVGADGIPRTALPLELVPAEGARGRDERYNVTTNERGEFEFVAIPPGSYLLGHQIISPHLVMPAQKSPPKTYYPGTPDRAGAVPIAVGNATQHNGLDFVVATEAPSPASR